MTEMLGTIVSKRSNDEWAALLEPGSSGNEHIQTRQSSATRSGWLIASSPLWLVGVLIVLVISGGGIYSVAVGMVLVVAAGVLYLATKSDLQELTNRGFSVTFSPHLVWFSPLVFLIIRGRHTREDFLSYRLAWAHVFFVLLAIFILIAFTLITSFAIGTAHRR